MMDLPINSQLKLDSTYKTGTYKVTFFVKDDSQAKNQFLELLRVN